MSLHPVLTYPYTDNLVLIDGEAANTMPILKKATKMHPETTGLFV